MWRCGATEARDEHRVTEMSCRRGVTREVSCGVSAALESYVVSGRVTEMWRHCSGWPHMAVPTLVGVRGDDPRGAGISTPQVKAL